MSSRRCLLALVLLEAACAGSARGAEELVGHYDRCLIDSVDTLDLRADGTYSYVFYDDWISPLISTTGNWSLVGRTVRLVETARETPAEEFLPCTHAGVLYLVPWLARSLLDDPDPMLLELCSWVREPQATTK